MNMNDMAEQYLRQGNNAFINLKSNCRTMTKEQVLDNVRYASNMFRSAMSAGSGEARQKLTELEQFCASIGSMMF